MHISKMKQSRYLKTADVDDDVLVTIDRVELEKIDHDSDEEKYVLYMQEFDKGLVLNWTNIQLLAKATGSEDTDTWAGNQVILLGFVSLSPTYSGNSGEWPITPAFTRNPNPPT